MTPEQLQAIRERAAKAVTQPLKAGNVTYGWNEGVRYITTIAGFGPGGASSVEEDASLVAREDIPALLAEVERFEMLAKTYLNDGVVAMLERDTAKKLAKQLAEALSDLRDWQTGPPAPSYKEGWTAALERAKVALIAYEAAMGKKA